MSMALVTNRPQFEAEFRARIDAAKNPRQVLVGSGRELANLLKTHFRKKDRSEPNKLSPRRSHFWLAVSRTVQTPVLNGNSVSVTINHPSIAQKVYGGPIVPKRASALTIPVEEQAYGRSAATFEKETGLKLFLIRNGVGAFARAVLAVRTKAGLVIEYVLKKRVQQKPDPTALPPESEMEKAILDRAQKILDRQLQNPGATPAP